MSFVKSAVENNLCSGCGLCVKKSDEMQLNDAGFLRPVIFDTNITKDSCPAFNVNHHNIEEYHEKWGGMISLKQGYSSDENIRKKGSSGGVLTGLLTSLVENKKVDYIIQVGQDTKRIIRNKTIVTNNIEEIINNAGSKYSPSSPLNVIQELLNDNNTYAVVGKPCDIAALRSFIEINSQYKNKFKYLLSFMCAGVPSHDATLNILKKFKLTEDDISEFRYRGDGWPGLTAITTKDGEKHTLTYNESWGTILNRNLQSRCKICADGIGEAADIVCADAWHSSENGYPSFEEADGRSLIIARTKNGKSLLDESEKNDVIRTTAFNINELDLIQPYQLTRKSSALARLSAVKLLVGKVTTYKDYKLLQLAKSRGPKLFIKDFLSTAKRVVHRKL